MIAYGTMLHPFAQVAAARTGLTRIGGIDVFDRNPVGLGFVLDEGLQLPPRPTMQTATQAFPRLNGSEVVFTDILARHRAGAQGDLDAAFEYIEKNGFVFWGVGTLVEMDACLFEAEIGQRLIYPN